MNGTTCTAVEFDDHAALGDGVPRARKQNDPGVCGVLQETQGSREKFFLCSPGVALHSSTRTWTCASCTPLQQRRRVARPPLGFRLNGQDVSAFTEENRDLRTLDKPNTSTQSEVSGARGFGTRILGSLDTAMRLCMSQIPGESQLWQRRS